MTRGEDAQLSAAKRAYRTASEEGNHQEEAKWANVVGDIYKNRGEYVVALKWLRIDYEVSVKHLPEKQLLPTCQSLGEIYLRLENFRDALIYQKKHLELAKDSSDEIEQQRACTQLGRTYHEMFLKSDDDYYSVRNAKKYFKSAMNLARRLKENPPCGKSSFLEEYIDAHNNIGMLEMDLDNLEEAQKILMKGLKICDEEEVAKDDAGRSRLHHNLGKVYMELREWNKAREHIENDILICKRIGHIQGEAKGYINLGELHYKVQMCGEAICCYQKALKLAKCMEDEDALADQIGQNIETVSEAKKVMDELKKEEQILKKLMRKTSKAKGTASERKFLLQQNASLDRLIEKASMIFAWKNHREFAKRKKRVASELCDQEKLSDSFLVLGESYQKLRDFSKALKWYTKSLKIYQLIGSLEGQALAKINIGSVLDSNGDWSGALKAFEEGYEIALQSKLTSVQLSALENMHYSQMIRFENFEEARRLQLEIDKLKQSKAGQLKEKNMEQDCCSETESDGIGLSQNGSDMHSQEASLSNSYKLQSRSREEEPEDDLPLMAQLHSHKTSAKLTTARMPGTSIKPAQASPDSKFRSTSSQQTLVGRKRIRAVLSDDEGEMFDEVECPVRSHHKGVKEDVATSDEFKNGDGLASPAHDLQDISEVASKCGTPINLEESTSSYKSRTKKVASQEAKDYRTSSTIEAVKDPNLNANRSMNNANRTENFLQKQDAFGLYKQAFLDTCSQYITFKIDESFVDVGLSSCMGMSNIECMKVEVACLYYLQLPAEKRSKGLLPIIKHLSCDGKPLETLEGIDTVKDYLWGKGWIEVSINGWVQKRLMKLYIDCCEEQSEPPNLKLLKKLYNLEVSEDEVVVQDCDLQDMSITPLLDALQTYKTVAVIDLSHNSLGNGTAEKLQKVLVSSGQSYGSLVLDLHCNRFGPTALFHICECPVIFARLEVLNISGNRMTDACGSYISTILQNCKGLYSLNIERCSITSRTIQKIVDSLDSDSVLSQICIGYNNPISANALVNLLGKLSTLKRFSDLNINGLKLSKPVLEAICQLSAARSLSVLMLGDTHIGTEGALQLTESLSSAGQELEKLDLSSCGLTSKFIARLNVEVSLITGILELNFGGNPMKEEGGRALASLLVNPQCCLKVLILKKCQLGPCGILSVLQALSTNATLEELNLAENIDTDKQCHESIKDCSNPMQTEQNISNPTSNVSLPENVEDSQLEVADSDDDDETRAESAVPVTVSSSQEVQMVQDMSSAIAMADNLRLLDLSKNGFSQEAAETLYAAWSSSGSRGGSAQRHVHETAILHLYVQGVRCCGVKPCCRRD